MSNAHKHGREGGFIQLELQPGADQARFAVRDDGPGIAAADQAQLFERFFRGDGETRRRTGFGLGLPIVRGLVELHGGQVWVESQPGAGTTVWVAVPLD